MQSSTVLRSQPWSSAHLAKAIRLRSFSHRPPLPCPSPLSHSWTATVAILDSQRPRARCGHAPLQLRGQAGSDAESAILPRLASFLPPYHSRYQVTMHSFDQFSEPRLDANKVVTLQPDNEQHWALCRRVVSQTREYLHRPPLLDAYEEPAGAGFGQHADILATTSRPSVDLPRPAMQAIDKTLCGLRTTGDSQGSLGGLESSPSCIRR